MESPSDVTIIIADSTLDLSEIQSFASEYTVRFGANVGVVSRWGGPAAGGIGWGGPELAVMVIAGELLRRTTSDSYSMLKAFIRRIYGRIRTRTGARLYSAGALSLVVESDRKSLRLLFCLPEGLDAMELDERLMTAGRDLESLLTEWESKPWIQEPSHLPTDIKLCWSEQLSAWTECEPPPPGYPRGPVPD
jgi:hypothetical protein